MKEIERETFDKCQIKIQPHEILYIKNFAVISYVIICNKYRKAGKAFRRARFLGLKLLDAKLVNNQPLSCEVRGVESN